MTHIGFLELAWFWTCFALIVVGILVLLCLNAEEHDEWD